jgi:hypothetical protein
MAGKRTNYNSEGFNQHIETYKNFGHALLPNISIKELDQKL